MSGPSSGSARAIRAVLLTAVPVSFVLAYLVPVAPLWIFTVAVVGIVPLADAIRRATEELAGYVGSAIGGLLNVTFGNLAELIIALMVLRHGHVEVVKAQVTGSLIGNSLLGLGLAIVIGAWGRERQRFKRERAGLLSSLLILAVIALLLPALFDYTERGLAVADTGGLDERLSLGVAVVLLVVYGANLTYTLVTHRDVFAIEEPASPRRWSLVTALAVLVAATVVIALEAELISGALDATAGRLGLSTFFLGIVVLAVIGNAGEYLAAAYFARRDRMGLVMTVTVGSTIQVALFTAPILVLASYFMGSPMNLVFNSPLELIAIAGAAFAVNAIAQDGETTWFEGVLLLSVYALFSLAFLFVSPPG